MNGVPLGRGSIMTGLLNAWSVAQTSAFETFREGSYEIRLAATRHEVDLILRLRHVVFKKELAGSGETDGLEFDDFDLNCHHLLVSHVDTGEVIGTYRINTLEIAGSNLGFYSAREFTI